MKQILILILTCSSIVLMGQKVEPLYWGGHLSVTQGKRLLAYTQPTYGDPSYNMGVKGPLTERLNIYVDMYFFTRNRNIGFDGLQLGMEYTSRRFGDWEFVADAGLSIVGGDILEYQYTMQSVINLDFKAGYHLGDHRVHLQAGVLHTNPGFIENIKDKSLLREPYTSRIYGLGASNLHRVYEEESPLITYDFELVFADTQTFGGMLLVQVPAFVFKMSYVQFFVEIHTYGEALGIRFINYSKR